MIGMADDSPKETLQPPIRKGRPRFHHERAHPDQGADHQPKDPKTGLDAEDTEEERATSRQHGSRHGKPPKKVYEEWASDPYCE
jgi:hypothetical protein